MARGGLVVGGARGALRRPLLVPLGLLCLALVVAGCQPGPQGGAGSAVSTQIPPEVPGPNLPGEEARTSPIAPNAPKELIGPVATTRPAARSYNGDLRRIPRTNSAAIERVEIPSPERPTQPAAAAPATSPMTIQSAKNQSGAPAVVTTTGTVTASVAALAPSVTTFVGLDKASWGMGWPADPNGDVGPNHYIEAVNTSFGIFDKATGNRLAAVTFRDFFTAAGVTDPCATASYGDPYVIYDRVSGRWFITDLGLPDIGNGPYYQCIAVSKSADPVAGGWWLYSYEISKSYLNDYPKFAAWHDGIYMTTNLFDMNADGSGSFYGVEALVFNRADMISGAPLRTISFVMPYSFSWGLPLSLLPAHDESGTATGPEYLFSDWWQFSQWTFTTNWANPNSSTLSGAANIPIGSYSRPSGQAPQKSSATQLDLMGDRLMSAAQWSKVNGVASVWIARTAASPKGIPAILWAQVLPGSSPSVRQASIFAPDDGIYRWMPSLAVDSAGNMAVGYSTSNASRFPGIDFAARTVDGPLEWLDLWDTNLYQGTGSQSGQYGRWGDYFSMSIDPVDGCTFWMTAAYLDATGMNWQTRISKFTPAAVCSTAVMKTATSLTYTGTTKAAKKGKITLSARLLAGTNGVANKTVSFLLNGQTYSALTSGTGTVSLSATAPANSGSYAIVVSFAGDPTYAASSASGALAVR